MTANGTATNGAVANGNGVVANGNGTVLNGNGAVPNGKVFKGNGTDATKNPYLNRSHHAKDHVELMETYHQWASSYDDDMITQGYVAPAVCAEATIQHSSPNATILDAGCGSGRVGNELRKLGATTIDGLDYSPAMLDVARQTGAYRKLDTVDLTKPVAIADATYDAVVCVGTLTAGHVGPSPALSEFLRVLKKGGVVVATVMAALWQTHGFDVEVEKLVKQGSAELISAEERDYRKNANVKARVVILRKL